MRLTLIQLSTFAAKWPKLRLTDEDLLSLEGLLIDNPEAGQVIPGTGGLRKLRFAPPSWHTGKRGASRVIAGSANRPWQSFKAISVWLICFSSSSIVNRPNGRAQGLSFFFFEG